MSVHGFEEPRELRLRRKLDELRGVLEATSTELDEREARRRADMQELRRLRRRVRTLQMQREFWKRRAHVEAYGRKCAEQAERTTRKRLSLRMTMHEGGMTMRDEGGDVR